MREPWLPQEADRQRIQLAWEATADRRRRNRLGQFATPPQLARQIAAATMALLPESKTHISFLDPALGTGAFYAAMRAEVDSRTVARATGVELDHELSHMARRVWRHQGLTVRNADFTCLAAPRVARRYSLILANPPYVRHHHLPAETKRRLREQVATQLHIDVSGLCGLYGYFLLLAHEWLAADGAAAWLLPAEWMDVNYGRALRQYLTTRVRLHRIHIFPADRLQFAGTLVTSAVVMFRKQPVDESASILLTSGASLEKPHRSKRLPLERLTTSDKWHEFFAPRRQAQARGVPLSDLFCIRRGLATGNNKFFISARHDSQFEHLPRCFLRPILPGPRHVADDVIVAGADGWPRNVLPLALLDCPLEETQVRRDYPRLWQHFQVARRAGVAGGYLLRHRRPWFRQEQRPPPPFLCTYMGRTHASRRALRFLWNHSQATAANSYLLLYPRESWARKLAGNRELQAEVFARLKQIDDHCLRREGRLYGGGLQKVEPAELQRATIPLTAAERRRWMND